jgi:predicted SnoaL-like aldol condensation-catalyzing enzyme
MRRKPALIVLLALTLVSLLAGSVFVAHAQDTASTGDLEANKTLARRWHDEIYEQGILATADEILTADFVYRSPPPDAFIVGPEAVKEDATGFREYFHDIVMTDDDVIAEGDRVVIRWTMTATAQTETGGIPVNFTGVDIFRIENGKLAELWQNADNLTFEMQLAAGSATPAASTPTT